MEYKQNGKLAAFSFKRIANRHSAMIDVNDLMNIDIRSPKDDGLPDEYKDFVFVDVQGFRAPRKFICKEFCLIDNDYEFHAIVKSTISFNQLSSDYKRNADWLTRFYHGIKFDSGDVDIKDVTRTIYPKIRGKTVLVKGEQKVNFFNYIFRRYPNINCVNIENLNFDLNLHNEEPYDICDYHNEVFGWKEGPCAYANALKLTDILINNVKKN